MWSPLQRNSLAVSLLPAAFFFEAVASKIKRSLRGKNPSREILAGEPGFIERPPI